jgi:hypothetical protein
LTINYKSFLFFSVSLVMMMSSCQLFNPAEPIPAYIHIDKIALSTTFSVEGSNSSKITDAWVYVDEQLVGCFELPATFPVLSDGSHHISIRPGIKINGIAATRSPYPFYTTFDTVINFQKGVKQTLSPYVRYRTNITFSFMEAFETPGTLITRSPAAGVDTVIQQVTGSGSNVFEGNGSGIVYLDNNRTFFEGVSSTSYALPKSGADVFLEFNYKCDHEFKVGVYAHATSGSTQTVALTINPSANWNKVYVYLTSPVSNSGNATDFSIFFGMINNTGTSSATMQLDNIKLVY